VVLKSGKLFYRFIFYTYICNMKTGKIIIGRITTEDYIKSNRKASREIELEIMGGWVSKHKVHKSVKNYTRKEKHRKVVY
jgi:hypothetical protein